MKIIYSSKFEKEYKKLPYKIKLIAEKKEKLFRKNPFNPILNTHKLHGRLYEFWSFSITDKYRIVFEFTESDIIYFHSVGTHEIYR
ncbi:MAG: type II toxin-antitoxin system mRNA interferase toxin, RelE/StbE family [Patescibacteria group bacterium]